MRDTQVTPEGNAPSFNPSHSYTMIFELHCESYGERPGIIMTFKYVSEDR